MNFASLVIAGGEKPSSHFIKKLLKEFPQIKTVAVDGGYDSFLKLRIKPDIFIGDGDSVKASVVRARKTVWLPESKSISDLEFALGSLPAKSAKLVLGAHQNHGDRIDHSFVNLLLALQIKNLFFADEKSWITGLHNQEFIFKTKSSAIFSMVSPSSVKVAIKGAHYSSKLQTLKSPSHGLSNETLALKQTKISIKGRALLFVNQSLFNTEF